MKVDAIEIDQFNSIVAVIVVAIVVAAVIVKRLDEYFKA